MSLDSMGPSAGSGGGTLKSNRMTHSLSTPSGVDGSAGHAHGGKKLAVRVQMLDDSVTLFQVQVRHITFVCVLSIFILLIYFREILSKFLYTLPEPHK